MSSTIKSGKWCIREVFEKWYLIPNYQRPYVWEKDQVIDLLDDISTTCETNPSGEYFLGSSVLKENKNEYPEYEVLDGQQRLTTLFLLTAVIRDLTDMLSVSKLAKRVFLEKKIMMIISLKDYVLFLIFEMK